MSHAFFNEQRDQSLVKAEIVAKYFNAWADVMVANAKRFPVDRIAYIDLFAGPGRYKDGAKSTPLMVLERAIAKPALAKRLVAMFNDGDPEAAESLRAAIDALPSVEQLKHQPRIFCSEVDEEARRMFEDTKLCPTFSFIDPFGYKGLSRGMIHSVIKDWGCDCVFFFNYPRINAGINNDPVRSHMNALFGAARIDRMRDILVGMPPGRREIFVLEELAQALRELGAEYILPFRFRRPDGSRVAHALVFVTKHILGYEIMKDIMARASSTEDQGVPSFEYSPADERCPLLLSLDRPLKFLAGDLITRFQGRTMSMADVYRRHHVDTRFVSRNYKKALGELEMEGKITVEPPAARRRMLKGERTFPDSAVVTFPAN